MSVDKRQLILQAAKQLFLRFGLRKTSVDGIARLAGIGKGTVYSYFPSKDDIWQVLLQQEVDLMLQNITSMVDQAETAVGKLSAFAESRFQFIREELNLFNLDQTILDEVVPYVSEFRERFLAREKNIISDILNYGVERGELRPINVELMAFSIVAALRGLEVPWIWGNRLQGIEGSIRSLLDIVLYGLLPRPV